jgi:hypothetical protein
MMSMLPFSDQAQIAMDVIGTQEEKNNFHNFCIEV